MSHTKASRCSRSFDEELLSGYLDGSLPQSQAQKVRLHLASCEACKAIYQEIELMRESAMATHFVTPSEDEWPELPRTPLSWAGRSLGWILTVSWLAVVAVLAVWRVISQSGSAFETFLWLGLPGGAFLLFSSVLFDRLRELKTDRYRGIHR